MRTFFLWILILFCANSSIRAQDITIQLLKDPGGFQPKNYYITKVVDDRTFKTKLGKIKEGDVHIEGGEASGLTNYFKAQFKKTNGSLPVVMHLKKLTVKEKDLGSKRQFDLILSIAYYSNGQQIVEYNGSAYIQTSKEPLPQIERLVRGNIISNLKQFDQWLGQNKLTVAAGPSVKVNVNFAQKSKDKYIIHYKKDRKLFITDFIAEPDTGSIGAAATFSGLRMEYTSRTLHQQTEVDLTLSVFFDKTKSWMKPHGKNITTLSHEQRHFDITALNACKLKTIIEQTEFSPGTYKEELKKLLYQIQKETGTMQEQYDEETYHGTAIDEQEKWDKEISEQVDKQRCFY